MQKKQCPNGHVYDPSIYGDSCPLCPPGTQPPAGAYDGGPKTHLAGAPMGGAPAGGPAPIGGPVGGPAPMNGPGTSIGGPAPAGADLKTHLAGGGAPSPRPMAGAPAGPDASGPTQVRSEAATPRGGGHTVIRRASNSGPGRPNAPERRLVGFLVTYNRNPAGRAFNIYEGRNYVGRDANCDIAVTDDGQMSGKHFSILYRTADGKFKFRDEQSTNGTFVNKELLDDGELQNYDIIRAGSTIFIFIAIPIIN